MEPSAAPVLLVDNEVCFLGSVSGLDGREVRAGEASNPVINVARWDHIEATTGLAPLRGS
jgi:hypothetical protein